jgi:hypothetical protein
VISFDKRDVKKGQERERGIRKMLPRVTWDDKRRINRTKEDSGKHQYKGVPKFFCQEE